MSSKVEECQKTSNSVEQPRAVKTPADLQRLKVEKLMRNPDKPAYIPDKPEEKLPRVFKPPEFVRNIWGSSAGAGSGDFHVYRGVRRREYARQKFMNEQAKRDEKDQAYTEKVKQNQKEAEERTAKKRAKRLKKKQRQKNKKVRKEEKREDEGSEESEEEEEEEEENNQEN